jgi:hypothetical protein
MKVDAKHKRASLICALIGLASILIAHYAKADVVKLDELTLTYRNYAWLNENNRPLLIYPESAKEALNLQTNIDLFKAGYFDSTVESLTTGAQYRAVGLQLNLGVRVTPEISIGYWHHSQHVLDRSQYESRPFPVEDAVELRWTIYHARPTRGSLFQ